MTLRWFDMLNVNTIQTESNDEGDDQKDNTIHNIRLLKPLSECRAHTIKLQVKNN